MAIWKCLAAKALLAAGRLVVCEILRLSGADTHKNGPKAQGTQAAIRKQLIARKMYRTGG
jgi:hypothetical protein